jgi:hypothetical protein
MRRIYSERVAMGLAGAVVMFITVRVGLVTETYIKLVPPHVFQNTRSRFHGTSSSRPLSGIESLS